MYEIMLEHSIDAAHRVVGHDGKCARLHGHTYRFWVIVRSAGLTKPEFVIDFAVIKDVLNEWDHRCLLWEEDPFIVTTMQEIDNDEQTASLEAVPTTYGDVVGSGIVRLPCNPTSENLSALAATRIMDAGRVLNPTIQEVTVTCSETPKSSSTWTAIAEYAIAQAKP